MTRKKAIFDIVLVCNALDDEIIRAIKRIEMRRIEE